LTFFLTGTALLLLIVMGLIILLIRSA
jgi:hypothetical protein